MSEVAPIPGEGTKTSRLRSLDALRGFDMFWIIGGDAIAAEIGKLAKNDQVTGVVAQFSDHVKWEGFRYYDMIFPLFLFIIGTAIPFSIGKRLEIGDSKREIILKVIRRTLVLTLLGLLYSGLLRFEGWDHLRLFGVLQRQAFGYCVASILFVTTTPRVQAIIFGSILFVYWALMYWIPVPGVPHGTYTEWGNVANYIDRQIMFPHQMYEKYGDPEGPFSDISAICTALLGLFAGQWLKTNRTGQQKTLGLAAAGIVSILLGLAWSPLFPIIKKIWTGSYVLVAGGTSLLLLALFYWIIDVKGWWKWSTFFAVIGMNAITIYLLTDLVDFGATADHLIGGALKKIPPYRPLGMAIGVVALEWLLLFFLWKKKVFVRV